MKMIAIALLTVAVVGGTLFAGCVGAPLSPFPLPERPPIPTLAIRNVKLCPFVSEEGEYTVQPGATFDRGDVVWLYFEVPGITAKGVDGKFEVWGKFCELTIYDPDGDIIEHLVDPLEFHYTDLDEAPNFHWFYAYYESGANDAVGQYRFEFTVKDGLSGATGTGSATFNLR